MMSEWSLLEAEIVEVLEDLSEGGDSLLAEVASRTAGDRKEIVAAIQRERLPAGYVLVGGRRSGSLSSAQAGPIEMSVVLATRSLRDDGETRVGADGSRGMWSIARAVALALNGRVVSETWELTLSSESRIGGAEGTLVWEQGYWVQPAGRAGAPTFGGQVLAGTASRVSVEWGELSQARSVFSFPGVDGVFVRRLGVRERAILWRGQLRAAGDAELSVLESALEDEVRSGEAKSMADGFGRSAEACVAKAFRRTGARQRDGVSDEAVQAFEMEFSELSS